MHEGTRCQALFGILAAFIVIPRGQRSIAWFSAVALPGIIILTKVGGWYQGQSVARTKAPAKQPPAATLPKAKIAGALAILIALIFSKYFYMASIGSHYTFYLIHQFGVSIQSAQIHLFVFLGAVAGGTIIGGPAG